MSEVPLYRRALLIPQEPSGLICHTVGPEDLLGVKFDPMATYRGTSLMRPPPHVGPYSSHMPRDLW